MARCGPENHSALQWTWYDRNARNGTVTDRGKFPKGKTRGNQETDRQLGMKVEGGMRAREKGQAEGSAGWAVEDKGEKENRPSLKELDQSAWRPARRQE
ncbi:hypothetical protein SRHO_G00061960 [Serrasalmus rhombeus]